MNKCRNGHNMTPENTGYKNICKKCKKIRSKKYRKEGKEKIAKYNKEYRDNNKEKIIEISKKYYLLKKTDEKFKEKRKNSQKIWQEKNKDINKIKRNALYNINRCDKKHLEKRRLYASNRCRTAIDEMTDPYMALLLGMRIKDVPVELLELKRVHLTLKRDIKNGIN